MISKKNFPVQKNMLLLKVLFSGISVCVGFVLLEIMVRSYFVSINQKPIMYRDTDIDIMRMYPNLNQQYYSEEGNTMIALKTTEDGYVGNQVSVEKPANTKRIAIVGDSYVQALQVDYDKNFVALLEQQFVSSPYTDKWQVLNFGMGGEGTMEQIIKYERFVKKYHPDIVVLAVYEGNDFKNNKQFLQARSPATSTTSPVPAGHAVDTPVDSSETQQRGLVKKVLLQSKTIEVLHRIARQNEFLSYWLIRLGVFHDLASVDLTLNGILPYLERTEESLEVFSFTETLLKELSEAVTSDGAQFVVMLIPSHWQTDEHYRQKVTALNPEVDFTLPANIVSGAVTDPVLNLYDVVYEEIQDTKSEIYLLSRGHLTAYGHELVAKQLYNFLINNVIP